MVQVNIPHRTVIMFYSSDKILGSGNALLYECTVSAFTRGPLAIVVTDAGSVIRCTKAELAELFYPPMYVMRHPLPAHEKALKVA